MADLTGSLRLWTFNILRDGPKRIGRLTAVLSTNPGDRELRNFAIWWHHLIACIFDLIGGPEIVQLAIRMLTETRPLRSKEIAAAAEVLGQKNIRFKEVRIANGGLWNLIFNVNKQRAFSTWHTINIPKKSESNIPLLIHELVHTYQYEQHGSVYIGQGLWVQIKYGQKAYDYGGAQGLKDDYTAGKRYSDYNREQQGQIAQDYCCLWLSQGNTSAYKPFIGDLQTGVI